MSMRTGFDLAGKARTAPPDFRALATAAAAALLAALLIFALARTAWRLYAAPRILPEAAAARHAALAPVLAARGTPVRLKSVDQRHAMHHD